MRLKIIGKGDKDGEVYTPYDFKIVDADTGEMLERVQSVVIEANIDACKATIVVLNPDVDIEMDGQIDETAE